MNESDEIREVYSATNLLDAEHMRHTLAESGIMARVTGSALKAIDGGVDDPIFELNVLVRREDFIDARNIIEQEIELVRVRRNRSNAWCCIRCGEGNSSEFAICWFCQNPQDADDE